MYRIYRLVAIYFLITFFSYSTEVNKLEETKGNTQPKNQLSESSLILVYSPKIVLPPKLQTRKLTTFKEYVQKLQVDKKKAVPKKPIPTQNQQPQPEEKIAVTEKEEVDKAVKKEAKKEPTISQSLTESEDYNENTPVPTQGILFNGKDERFNYASVDCAAGVMKTNKGARSASSILHKDKDRYLLDKCTSERFIVIELCQDINIATVVLGNFEFFSSTFRTFNLLASSHYPPKKDVGWHLIGTYLAKDVRGLQAFDTNLKSGFFRYIKLEFLTHYGQEYYCPITQVMVFGKSYFHDFEENKAEKIKVDPEGLVDPLPVFNSEQLAFALEEEEEVDDVTFQLEGSDQKSDSTIGYESPSPISTQKNDVSSEDDLGETQECSSGSICTDNTSNATVSLALPKPTHHQRLSELFCPPKCSIATVPLTHNAAPTSPYDPSSHFTKLFTSSLNISTTSLLKYGPLSSEEGRKLARAINKGCNVSHFPDNPYPIDKGQCTNDSGYEIDNKEQVLTSQPTNQPSTNGGSENVFIALSRRLDVLEAKLTLMQGFVDDQASTFNSIVTQLELHLGTQFQEAIAHLSRTTRRQIEELRRSQAEVWRLLNTRITANKKGYDSDSQQMRLLLEQLTEEVNFGKKLIMMQLVLLSVVVGAVILVLIYYLSFNYNTLPNITFHSNPELTSRLNN